MRFGICITKKDDNANRFYEAIREGILHLGHNFVILEEIRHLNKHFKKIDYFIMFNWKVIKRKTNQNKFRNTIVSYGRKYNKDVICYDSGFTSSDYMAFSLNGIKGLGDFKNQNSPSDRWEALNIKIQPWQNNDGPILLFCQRIQNSLCSDINLYHWHKFIALTLRDLTEREVIIRKHPGDTNPKFDEKWFIANKFKVTHQTDVNEDLKNCYACVGLTTNAFIHSLINGIPFFTLHENSYFYPIGNQTLRTINSPILTCRQQFLYNLAYAQWSIDEINKGMQLQHLIGTI